MRKNIQSSKSQMRNKIVHTKHMLREIQQNYSNFNRYSVDRRLKSFNYHNLSKKKLKQQGKSLNPTKRDMLRMYTAQQNDMQKQKFYVQLWQLETISKSFHVKLDPTCQIADIDKKKFSRNRNQRPKTQGNLTSTSQKIFYQRKGLKNGQIFQNINKDGQIKSAEVQSVMKQDPEDFCNFILGFPDQTKKDNEFHQNRPMTCLTRFNQKVKKSQGLKKIYKAVTNNRQFIQFRQINLNPNLISTIYANEFMKKNRQSHKCSRILAQSRCIL